MLLYIKLNIITGIEFSISAILGPEYRWSATKFARSLRELLQAAISYFELGDQSGDKPRVPAFAKADMKASWLGIGTVDEVALDR